MSNVIYCTYCNKFWKGIEEYEHHKTTICTHQIDMSKHRTSKKNLYELIEDLTKRLDRAEHEISRLRGIVQSKNRKIIHDWLNQTKQTPATNFDTWRKEIQAHSKDVEKMMGGSISGGLTEGVISCVEAHINASAKSILPIRCFTQKPKTFYVYAVGDDGINKWRIIRNESEILGPLMDSVERKLRRKYNAERREAEEEEEEDLDQHQMIMEKINGTRVSQEKRLGIFKKWLFLKLEENLTPLMECEFE